MSHCGAPSPCGCGRVCECAVDVRAQIGARATKTGPGAPNSTPPGTDTGAAPEGAQNDTDVIHRETWTV